MKYYYVICEGPHDRAAIGKALKTLEFRIIKNKETLPEIWLNLIPDRYPFQGNSLERESPVPEFYGNGDITVAIKAAGGDSNLLTKLDNTLLTLKKHELEKIKGISVYLDADDSTAELRINDLITAMDSDEYITLSSEAFRNGRGNFKGINMKTNIYVFPNNRDSGTLEDMLLQGGNIEFPDLIDGAKDFLEEIPDRYKDKLRGSKFNKVLVGVIANIFNAGKANQVSIKNNKWITKEKKENCESIRAFYENLENFLEINN